MKPESQISQPTPEQSLVKTLPTVERPQNIQAVETGIDKSAENFEQRSDLSAIAADVASTTSATNITVTDVGDDKISTTILNPVVASDDDLIEKEWVDRAKKIISETHDDPYKREQEVSRVKSDYIKKRYGRELGVSD